MNLEKLYPHQRVELIQLLMHNQIEFKWLNDHDCLQFKFKYQKDWNWLTTGFMRLIQDILANHGYEYSYEEILDIFRDDEIIHNDARVGLTSEDIGDIIIIGGKDKFKKKKKSPNPVKTWEDLAMR
ncbi:hypothetical protein [Draconibacterium orientale]|uniref:hypothetical protein n=1 Tax=Draconibacterium orientale TaxID=1168034 RepID=UPI002A0A41D2|nr:hypothetical protein [Draconibacterium orientale]